MEFPQNILYLLIVALSRLSRLLDYLDYLVTHDQQFGFKRKHSTDLCIFTVKSVTKYYTQKNCPVFTCFLDASKAFDKINHYTLFQKLLDRETPIILVRILLFWYTKQTMCVKWGNCMSDYFYVSITGLDKEEYYLQNCIQCMWMIFLII